MHGGKHDLKLSNNNRPGRTISETERFVHVKDKALKIKGDILTNMGDNIRDQCNNETNYYHWLTFDLSDKTLNLDQRIERGRVLLEILTSEVIHTVHHFANAKQTNLEANQWLGYTVYLHYPPQINCSFDVLENKIRNAWADLGQLWFRESNSVKGEKREPDELKTFQSFITNNAIQYPYF